MDRFAGRGGKSIADYNAYRVTGARSSTATFTKINTAPIASVTFTDASVAPSAYCYYVTASLNGIESVPSNQAAAAILVLPPGYKNSFRPCALIPGRQPQD